VSPPIRWIAGLGRYIPVGPAMAMLNHIGPAIISWTQGLDPDATRLYEQVYARGSKRLLQWGAEAMRQWESSAKPRAPVFRAHGRLDFVIPLNEPLLRPGIDLVVPGGLHLIHLSHARAVNRWIERTIARGANRGGGV
jgi:pimeloyl-ACP methyl ester carboxylesterase